MKKRTTQEHEAFYPELRRLGEQMPPEFREELKRLHEDNFMCNAASEGQLCCVEYMLGYYDA